MEQEDKLPTVQELRDSLQFCDPEDPVEFILEEKGRFGRSKYKRLIPQKLLGGSRLASVSLKIKKEKKYSWFSNCLYKFERWLDRHNHKMELLRTLSSFLAFVAAAASLYVLLRMNGLF